MSFLSFVFFSSHSDSSLNTTRPSQGDHHSRHHHHGHQMGRISIVIMIIILCRIDTGADRRISKEEFTSPAIKASIETVVIVQDYDYDCIFIIFPFQWVGPVTDMAAEFDKVDRSSPSCLLSYSSSLPFSNSS